MRPVDPTPRKCGKISKPNSFAIHSEYNSELHFMRNHFNPINLWSKILPVKYFKRNVGGDCSPQQQKTEREKCAGEGSEEILK